MNFVFDLGGVLLRWEPEQLLTAVSGRVEERRLLREGLLQHADWLDLDRGTRGVADVISRTVARTGLNRKLIQSLLSRVPASLVPNKDVFVIARALSKRGHSLYVLSNMHMESVLFLRRNAVLEGLFVDEIYSSEIGKIKPEAEIFDLLLSRCALRPSATLFIDDMPENVSAARQAGIEAVRYTDAHQLARQLAQLGYLGHIQF